MEGSVSNDTSDKPAQRSLSSSAASVAAAAAAAIPGALEAPRVQRPGAMAAGAVPPSAAQSLGLGEEAVSINSHYDIGSTLGRGGFSTVRAAQCRRTQEWHAVKCLTWVSASWRRRGNAEMSQRCLTKREVQEELEIWRKVSDHDCVVQHIATYVEPTRAFLVMELCAGGPVSDYIAERAASRYLWTREAAEADARMVMRRLLRALAHAHAKGVLHRDVKVENILLGSADNLASAKLADFGLSVAAPTPGATKLVGGACGTSGYLAPELAFAEPSQATFSGASDVWAAGVCLFALMFAKLPFADPALARKSLPSAGGSGSGDVSAFAARFYQDQLRAHSGLRRASPHAREAVMRMLANDPSARPSAQEALQLPFFAAAQEDAPSATALTTGSITGSAAAGTGGAGAGGEQDVKQLPFWKRAAASFARTRRLYRELLTLPT